MDVWGLIRGCCGAGVWRAGGGERFGFGGEGRGFMWLRVQALGLLVEGEEGKERTRGSRLRRSVVGSDS